MTPAYAIRNTAQRRATALVAAVLLAAWGLPALGSSSIAISSDEEPVISSDDTGHSSSSLAGHSESTLEQLVEDDSVTVPALAEVTSESSLDNATDRDGADEIALRSADTPVIRSRLPGVPKTALPSFRRQMFRTDI